MPAPPVSKAKRQCLNRKIVVPLRGSEEHALRTLSQLTEIKPSAFVRVLGHYADEDFPVVPSLMNLMTSPHTWFLGDGLAQFDDCGEGLDDLFQFGLAHTTKALEEAFDRYAPNLKRIDRGFFGEAVLRRGS